MNKRHGEKETQSEYMLYDAIHFHGNELIQCNFYITVFLLP